MKTFPRFFSCLLLLLLASGAPAQADDDEKDAAVVRAALITTAPVELKSISESITAYGVVQSDPSEVHSIAMPRDGVILKVFVRLGQTVKSGDAVIEIGNSPGTSAQYDQAKVAVDYATRELERNRHLLEQHVVTRDQVAQSEKSLSAAQSELSRMVGEGADQTSQGVCATFDGIITDVAAKPGDRLQSGAVTATIGSRDKLVVALGIEPEDVSRISLDMAVRLTSPLNRDIGIDATISRMNGIVNASTHLVDGLVELSPPASDNLILGMTLQAAFAVPLPKGAVIPRAALMQDENGTYVFTVDGNVAHKLAVSPVMETETEAALKEPLTAGTKVVVAGNAALEDGMSVRETATKGDSE